MNDRLRVGLLSAHNPYDRTAFSGTVFYMRQALEAHPDVDLVVLGRYPRRPSRLLETLRHRLGRPRQHHWERVDGRGLDAIVVPVSHGLVTRHGKGIEAPVILVTDATPGFLREFYGAAISAESERNEERAIALSACTIYSSHYMAERAVQEFPRIDPAKIRAIPFGLNADAVPDAVPPKPPLRPLRLLFIAKEWERKGGSVAVAALRALRARGVPAQLTVIGSSAPEALADPDVEVIPYLDKNRRRDARRFADRLARAHILLLPTRADCTPMVIAEANAYGCPVLVTRTGGIPSLVEPGRNGDMMPPEADGAAYAARIERMIADPGTFEALGRSSFDHGRERLTWSVWTRDIVDVVRTDLRRRT